MDWKLELVAVPVSDVDRAKAFYTDKVGFNADHDHTVSDEMRFVQLTPPGLGLLDRDRQGDHRRRARARSRGCNWWSSDIEARKSGARRARRRESARSRISRGDGSSSSPIRTATAGRSRKCPDAADRAAIDRSAAVTALLRILILDPLAWVVACIAAGATHRLRALRRGRRSRTGWPCCRDRRRHDIRAGAFSFLPALIAIVLAEAFGWRSVFYWLAVGGGIGLAANGCTGFVGDARMRRLSPDPPRSAPASSADWSTG